MKPNRLQGSGLMDPELVFKGLYFAHLSTEYENNEYR